MPSIRDMPLGYITAISFLGSVLAKLLRLYEPKSQLIKIFFGLFSAQVILFSIYAIHVYPHFLSPLRRLPQVEGGWPLIGHGINISKYGPGVLARKWILDVKNDGLIRVLCHFNIEIVIVNSPRALSEILGTKSYSFEKPKFLRQSLANVIGWGLITAEGDEHKTQRRNMLPAFSFHHIKTLYPIFWQKACEAVHAITAECNEDGFLETDISSWTNRCTLDIIGLAGIGVDFGAIKDKNAPLVKSCMCLQPSPADVFLIMLKAFLPKFVMENLPIPRITSLATASRCIRDVCHDLVSQKKTRVNIHQDTCTDILTVALASNLFSEDNLVDQMMTFLTVGHETVSSALLWSIYLIAKFPHIQQRLRDEVRQNLPSANSDIKITSTDIDRLSYLHATCSEVLRIYCPVAQTCRISNSNTIIQGQFIPRNTVLVLVPWATNTDPKLWGADAHEFKPERWLNLEQGGTSPTNAARGGATSNYAFMTFLHGPRSCIGTSFARSELACLLAAWVGRFSFELKDKSLADERNIKINPSVTSKPDGGLHVIVKVIEGW